MSAAATVETPDRLLERLEWTVLRRLDGLLQGDYRTLFRGVGLDLADLREYQYYDDVRHIDWNVTARLQTPYVREYTEDRELAAWFVLDLSPSVDFGSGEVTKRQVSAEFVAVIARLLMRHGNRVGALLYGDALDQVLPARSGRRHLLQLLDRVSTRPGAQVSRQTDLAQFLRAAANVVKRRSMIFVVSDFISEPGWERALGQLARRHEVVAVRLVDPLESSLPDLGLVTMRDAETGETLFVDTHDRGFRRRFEAAALEREEAVMAAFGSAGVDALELATDEDLAGAIYRFVQLRKRRSRLASGAGAAAAVPQ
jgi:uncharacterized protein (DUF58 family)